MSSTFLGQVRNTKHKDCLVSFHIGEMVEVPEKATMILMARKMRVIVEASGNARFTEHGLTAVIFLRIYISNAMVMTVGSLQ